MEDITEALWGTRVSPSVVSDLNKKIYKRIDKWRNATIEGTFPYVYLDGIVMKRSCGQGLRPYEAVKRDNMQQLYLRK